MNADTTTEPLQVGQAPFPVMQLTNWPLIYERRLALGVLLLTFSTTAAVYWLSRHEPSSRWLVPFAAMLLLLCFWRVWIPIRYELDVRGIQQIIIGRRQFIPWQSVHRFLPDPNGVTLYTNIRARWQFSDSLYIASPQRQEELSRLVSFYCERAKSV